MRGWRRLQCYFEVKSYLAKVLKATVFALLTFIKTEEGYEARSGPNSASMVKGGNLTREEMAMLELLTCLVEDLEEEA